MPRFKGRAKRWKRKFQRERWRSYKKELLAKGWVEVGENTLVPPASGKDYPPFVPTHLGGKIAYEDRKKMAKQATGLPKRSVVKRIKKQAEKEGLTLRQFFSGNW